jgi:hypothetical protein
MILCGGCDLGLATEITVDAPAILQNKIVLESVSESLLQDTLRASGRISVNENHLAKIGPSISGRVLEVRANVGCTGLFQPPLPDDQYRLACGQQCLKNGEDCSHFFALKNEERRLNFEQAKANYWLCMRRFAGSPSESQNLCVAPGPQAEAYDHCGDDLQQCLAACPVTLDELPGLHGAGRSQAGMTSHPASSPP